MRSWEGWQASVYLLVIDIQIKNGIKRLTKKRPTVIIFIPRSTTGIPYGHFRKVICATALMPVVQNALVKMVSILSYRQV